MAPYTKRVSELECHAHHPDAAQQMISMGMGDEKVTDELTTYSGLFKLGKDTIAATSIDKQHTLFAMKREASVVASGSQSIASTEHGDIVVPVMHKFRLAGIIAFKNASVIQILWFFKFVDKSKKVFIIMAASRYFVLVILC